MVRVVRVFIKSFLKLLADQSKTVKVYILRMKSLVWTCVCLVSNGRRLWFDLSKDADKQIRRQRKLRHPLVLHSWKRLQRDSGVRNVWTLFLSENVSTQAQPCFCKTSHLRRPQNKVTRRKSEDLRESGKTAKSHSFAAPQICIQGPRIRARMSRLPLRDKVRRWVRCW